LTKYKIYERQHGDKTEHSNEMIDKARTHLNYNLAPHNVKPMKFIDDRLKERMTS